MKKFGFGFVVVMFACCVVAVPNVFSDIVVPSTLTNIEGNTSAGFPFSIIGTGRSMRYQQVYSASEFGGLGEITQMAFRGDGVVAPGSFAATFTNISIQLSTTSKPADGLSLTFNDNVGSDVTTVFSGGLSLSSAGTGPLGGPKDFDIVITFATPFSYNPAAGNLLLDVRNFGGFAGSIRPFDAQNTFGDSTSRLQSACNVLTGACNGVNDATGGPSTTGFVTRFSVVAVTPVAEPNSLLLTAISLAMFALFSRLAGKATR